MNKKLSICSAPEFTVMQLYLGDYRRKLHIRETARLLKANHRTVLLALQRLEKLGIMRYERSGRNKSYFLNLENNVAREFIKISELCRTADFLRAQFMFKKFLTEISAAVGIMPIIIFGSYAKGEETKTSDIDLLVLNGRQLSEVRTIVKDFGRRHGKNIQLQAASTKSFEAGLRERDHLVLEIVKNHIVLNNVDYFVNTLWRHYNEIG